MQPSTRTALASVLGAASLAASGPIEAQSLTDALSGPASRAVALGTWTTEVAAAFQPDAWRPTIIFAKPVKAAKAPMRVASVVALEHSEADAAVQPLRGIASYYGRGELTAAGELFDPNAMTAAHRTLPFGTKVRVTRVDTGDSVVVRINDRGPFKPGRVIDLSERAAENLGMTGSGLADVRLEVVGP